MKAEVRLGYAHRLLSPRPVCLLTTRYKGQVNVMTIAWTSPISLDPPFIAMAIFPGRYTHDMLTKSGEFVLNIPGRPLIEQVISIGSTSGEDVNKVEQEKLALESGKRVEVPWIDRCIAHIEGTIVDVLAAGDHSVFVGELCGAWADEAAFREFWVLPQENEELRPLIHLGGKRFATLGDAIAGT